MAFKIIFILLIITLQANCEDEADDETPRSCYKFTTDFLNQSITTVLKCLGEKFKPKNIFEYATRSYCILKCVLQELGTIDPEGRFDDIAAAFFFEENFAPEVQESLLPKVQSCFALAELFDDKDYWCKTYSPFINCLLKALVSSLIPYSVNCFTGPGLNILLETLNAIAPDPLMKEEVNELRREMRRQQASNPKCLNANCTQKYLIKKVNGTSSIILYHKNMTEISRTFKSAKILNPTK